MLDLGVGGPGFKSHHDAVGKSRKQTVYTHCASVHEAAKLVAVLKGCGGNCRPGGK